MDFAIIKRSIPDQETTLPTYLTFCSLFPECETGASLDPFWKILCRGEGNWVLPNSSAHNNDFDDNESQ